MGTGMGTGNREGEGEKIGQGLEELETPDTSPLLLYISTYSTWQ